MRSLLVLLSIVVCSVTYSYAQEYSIGTFYSVPLGNYAADDINDGGYASTGWGVTFETLQRKEAWPKGLEIGFTFSYQKNEIDGRALGQDYTELVSSGQTVTVSKCSYSPLTATLGPAYRWFFTDKVSVLVKAGAGIMLTNIDPIGISVYDSNRTLLVREEVNLDVSPSFTYLAGINISYDISESIRLNGVINHSSAKEMISSSGEDDYQKINYVNFGLSVALKF